MSIKKKILDSIEHVQNKMGYTLVTDDWGNVDEKCACPLGCVILKNNPEADIVLGREDNTTAAAELLGVSESWINSFIEGFDEVGFADAAIVPEAWKLGNEISKETKPISYYDGSIRHG